MTGSLGSRAELSHSPCGARKPSIWAVLLLASSTAFFVTTLMLLFTS